MTEADRTHRSRKLVAYEPVDWIAVRPKPLKPSTPKPLSRKALEGRLKELNAQADKLCQQLNELDD